MKDDRVLFVLDSRGHYPNQYYWGAIADVRRLKSFTEGRNYYLDNANYNSTEIAKEVKEILARCTPVEVIEIVKYE
jgi:hypothetical protein